MYKNFKRMGQDPVRLVGRAGRPVWGAGTGSVRAVSLGGQRVEIVLLSLETPEGRDGALGPTYTAGSATEVIEAGSEASFYLAIDRLLVDGAAAEPRCAISIGSLGPGDGPVKRQTIENDYAHVWWVRIRPLPSSPCQ